MRHHNLFYKDKNSEVQQITDTSGTFKFSPSEIDELASNEIGKLQRSENQETFKSE